MVFAIALVCAGKLNTSKECPCALELDDPQY